jgi:lecithin-cholesterol acyltransferase
MRVRHLLFATASVLVLALIAPAPANAATRSGSGLTPIVLFPAFHLTRLLVTVHNQSTDPACPRSGTFED